MGGISASRGSKYAENRQKKKAKGAAWADQSPGQIQAAKALIEAEEGLENQPRNQRNKMAMERPKEMPKAQLEGGGTFAAFSRAGEGMADALRCAED
eukprot:544174-Pyramimonas_sp.AAC.1